MVLQPVVPSPRVDHGTLPLHIRTLRAVTELVTHARNASLQFLDLPLSLFQLSSLTRKPILVFIQRPFDIPSVGSLVIQETLELSFQSLHLGFQGRYLKLSLVSLLTRSRVGREGDLVVRRMQALTLSIH